MRRPRDTRPTAERFWELAAPGELTACWPWTGNRTDRNYGRLHVNGLTLRAHRVSFEINVAPIPIGLCVLHTCDNPPCVNPAHLWLGTDADNQADKARKGRSHKHGPRGEQNGKAKLTRAQVENIKALVAAGEPRRRVADLFGVRRDCVAKIVNGHRWIR